MGIILGSCWDHVGIIVGSFWDHFGIMLGSFWDNCGISLELFWDHCGIILGSFWDHFGIIVGSFGDHFGIIFNPFWDHCGIILGSFWDHFVILAFKYLHVHTAVSQATWRLQSDGKIRASTRRNDSLRCLRTPGHPRRTSARLLSFASALPCFEDAAATVCTRAPTSEVALKVWIFCLLVCRWSAH